MNVIKKTVNLSLKESTKSYLLGACLTVGMLASASGQAAFEGLISPKDAFDWASTDSDVYILDVRTGEEWKWVGHPGPNKLVDSKSGKANGLNYNAGAYLEGKVVNIASMVQKDDESGGLKLNDYFVADVNLQFDPLTDTLLVICRSGGRAQKAAEKLAKEADFTTYNIADGFQGPSNSDDYPGRDTGYRDVAGWVNDGLPWNQSSIDGYYSQ